MKNKTTKTIALMLLGIGTTTVNAQQVITTTSGNASGNGGTVNYTVGQIAYSTHNNTNGTITQGVQQPYDISPILGANNHSINLEFTAYPNPTSDFLILNINHTEPYNLNFELYDISGKTIETRKIKSLTETISMNNLPSAIYFLKVTDKNKDLKTFKIIKN